MSWNFSFNGTDHFEVSNGRLLCDWDKAANDFEANVPDIADDLPEMEAEVILSNLYDCGQVTKVVFEVCAKELEAVILWVGKRKKKFVLGEMIESDEQFKVLVEDFRDLYKKVPQNIRSVS